MLDSGELRYKDISVDIHHILQTKKASLWNIHSHDRLIYIGMNNEDSQHENRLITMDGQLSVINDMSIPRKSTRLGNMKVHRCDSERYDVLIVCEFKRHAHIVVQPLIDSPSTKLIQHYVCVVDMIGSLY